MNESNTLARRQMQDQELATPRRELTLENVSEMTGYDLPAIAMIRHNMATSMGTRPENVPLYDIALFCHAARQLDLDPLLRQCYWITRKGKGTLQVGIDGYRSIAERSGIYAGSQSPEFRDWSQIKVEQNRFLLVPGVARVTVWKIIAGRSCAFTGEAYWDEWYPGPGNDGFMYRKMPRHMLAKDAEAQALRKAFPAMLSKVEYASTVGTDVSDVAAPTTAITEERPAVAQRPASDAATHRRIFDANYADDLTQASYVHNEPDPEPESEVPMEIPEDSLKRELLSQNKALLAEAQQAGVSGLGPFKCNDTWPADKIDAANKALYEKVAKRNGDAETAKAAEAAL